MINGYTTVFKYNIFFEGSEDRQERYVVASTEEEANAKIESYRRYMVAGGFADFTYTGAWVELDGVIF